MKNDSVQGENSVFFQQLDICCKKVAVKVGKKDISEWKNSDFIKLSELLHDQTKVTLSDHTLKRIFGKLKTSTRYFPQKATRDALAQFIGYRDWHEFELLNPLQIEKIDSVQKQPMAEPETEPVTKSPATKMAYLFGTLFLLILSLGFGFYFFYPNFNKIEQIKLICINPEGGTPHSAIFNLAIKGKGTDIPSDFTIDFGDRKRKKNIAPNQAVNHYYELPGRFYPTLHAKDVVVDTAVVYLKTKGWSILTSLPADTSRFYSVYSKINGQNGVFRATAAEISAAGIDTNKTFYVSYINIKPTTINADNLKLKVNVKTSANRPGVRCSQFNIYLYGEVDRHFIDVIKPECVAWASYQFSEIQKDGEISDLRALGHDLTAGANVTLNIADKKVKLYINKQLVFQTQYKKPIGKLMGVKILFAGLGQFQNLELKDLKTGQSF
ncbi:hypothetical protein CA265_01445 [Sphingobacteriaceae bacterium GW460-11-11-14-LB5]|nr:hypothetical protein CA265_01445 [Sphingobacteriaceae bacterium GW460-11-11-14-LB5]